MANHPTRNQPLQQSKNPDLTVLRTDMDGFWIMDLHGHLLEANERYCRMSGYTTAELLAMAIADLDACETAEEIAVRIRAVVSRDETRFETRHRRKDGSVYDIEVSARYLPVEDGRIVVYLRDITGRKQAEEALRNSLKTSDDIVNAIPAGFFIYQFVEPDRLLLVSGNPAAERLSGIRCADWQGREFNEIWPAAKELGITESYLQVMRTGETFETEDIYYQDDKVSGAFRIRAFELPGKKLAVAFENITERRKAEEALRQSEALTTAILDNLPVGIAVNSVDPAVTFEYMNDNFPGCYRTTREKLADPDSFWSAVYEDPDFREKIKKRVLEDCASGDPRRMYWPNVPITRTGKATTYITARNIPVPDKQLMISMVWDVTEYIRAEEAKEKLQEQLTQAQKMESVGRLAGGVAHDFNNMLGVILGHAELALERIDPADPLHDDLLQIQLAARRSGDLTRQLLAFARKQTVLPKVLDLNSAVEGMLKMLQRLIGEDIDLLWRPGRETGSVKMDPAQLNQILANLCVNARDAIKDVGTVTIETDKASFDEQYCADHPDCVPGENYVLLAMSDNGCGMEKETIDKAFEPFFTTKEVGQGTGLGLSTVYGIVRQNNGFIDVDSEPGQGTTFRVYLPRRADGAGTAGSKKPEKQMARGNETVLLVEDEPALLAMGSRMLERQGYRVLAAATPAEAVLMAEKLPAGEVHLLLTDVVMPEMNGRDLAATLASIHPGLKCLFMSGYTANVIAHHGVLDEGVHFIQKPFSAKDLAVEIRETLDSTAGDGPSAP